MMKNSLRHSMKLFVVLLCVFAILSVHSSALITRLYTFNFPSDLSNSMRYTYLFEVDGGTPFVYPSVSTIATQYFLSPNTYGWTQATNVVTISNREWRSFSWYSGYGGSGQSYCLAGCPDADNGSWLAYHIEGDFGE